MRFLKSLFFNEGGMTLAEMTIAGALVGVAALGVSAVMGSMSGSGKDAERVIERTELGSAMGVFLNSARGCYNFQQGTIISSTEVPYITADWVENGKNKNWDFDGFKNFHSNMDLRYNNIKYLTAQRIDVPNVNAITLKVGGVLQTLKKAVIKVKLGVTEKANERDSAKKRAIEDKYPETRFEYNIPVLVDATSSRVEICGDNSTMAEACFSLKGIFDSDTGKCVLPTNCESFGSFSTVNCAPKYKSVTCNDYSRGTPFVNPVTGGYSCPTGASAVSTGGQTWYRNIDCGKKCTARINFSIGYYSCLKCE